ncbi:S1C family serine protease [Sphingobacterium bovistauri]|uniref:Trypsin-like peptidase domain-containing protein n=1 Tax=Sphingobacterium bovistauri TaxID=2781959 RepID=A0ABS7Z4S5_9SPHI|nr:serine protease [Sphingobacterium bovistauri]MCA5005165.1 trypsin-like peptidase domain-containing protein [Sphingobacterium bovistauri]
MQRHKFIEWADQYLRGELEQIDIQAFEDFCASNPEYAQILEEHKTFLITFQQSENRNHFKAALAEEATHIESYGSQNHFGNKVISFWSKLQINTGIAAAVAFISVFTTLWLTGYFTDVKKATSDYSALRREMNSVKRNVTAQNKVIQNINKNEVPKKDISSHFGATGFLLTKDGYVVTNYHVVNGADSIQLQNQKGKAFRAEIIHTDAAKDLAILRIADSSFRTTKTVPYTFKKQLTDVGEDIYTIGFPRDEAVYGQGYLSSNTGYSGDTIAYQISIPVNPGNSGGPVLDTQGNVVGIISGKQKGIDGAAFAIKTKELIETLNRIPTESLKGNIVLNNKNSLNKLSRTEQIKKLQDFIYIVKVY